MINFYKKVKKGLTFLSIYAIMEYNLRKELVMKMFKADITVTSEDGSIGAKVIYASSLGQVMDDAEHMLTSWIRESRETDNPIIKHKVIGGEAPEYD